MTFATHVPLHRHRIQRDDTLGPWSMYPPPLILASRRFFPSFTRIPFSCVAECINEPEFRMPCLNCGALEANQVARFEIRTACVSSIFSHPVNTCCKHKKINQYSVHAFVGFTSVLYGTIVIGPVLHFWYGALEAAFPGFTPGAVFRKALTDQIVAAPIMNGVFYVVLGAMVRFLPHRWGLFAAHVFVPSRGTEKVNDVVPPLERVKYFGFRRHVGNMYTSVPKPDNL